MSSTKLLASTVRCSPLERFERCMLGSEPLIQLWFVMLAADSSCETACYQTVNQRRPGAWTVNRPTPSPSALLAAAAAPHSSRAFWRKYSNAELHRRSPADVAPRLLHSS